jgi:hypothetical protein
MHACHRITGRGLVSVYSASSLRGAAWASAMGSYTSGTTTTASYVRQGEVRMPRRKAGAKPEYRLRRIIVEFEYDEDTSQAFDEDDVKLWFKQNEPEFRVTRVTFPDGTYWDEKPDPTLIPDKS